MRIHIETIPHQEQRYSTTGDWWWAGDNTLELRVSDLGDWRHSALIALHELVEAWLCKAHGITTEMVDQWDMGPGAALEDPAADPRAPYHQEHDAAEAIERLLAHIFDVNWDEYNDAVIALYGGR